MCGAAGGGSNKDRNEDEDEDGDSSMDDEGAPSLKPESTLAAEEQEEEEEEAGVVRLASTDTGTGAKMTGNLASGRMSSTWMCAHQTSHCLCTEEEEEEEEEGRACTCSTNPSAETLNSSSRGGDTGRTREAASSAPPSTRRFTCSNETATWTSITRRKCCHS
jgi:hypothetical protein